MNLLKAFENWTEFLDEGHGVDVIYLDYRKAFDTVPHKRLTDKYMSSWNQRKSVKLDQSISQRQRNEGRGLVVRKQFSAWAPVTKA